MVQLFYYESCGKCCRRLVNYEGRPTKVLLFPYEGWAQPALLSYWLLKTYWWSRSKCKVVEVCGNRKRTAKGRMVDKGDGKMIVTGKFKEMTDPSPEFRMTLTTSVSKDDFQLGYCLTGSLERGDKPKGDLEMTHFAMVRRKGY